MLALAREAGELPDEDDVERRLCAGALVYHPAELWSIRDAPALGLVDVLADDEESVLLRVVAERSELCCDGEVDVLPVAGHACIDGCGCVGDLLVHGEGLLLRDGGMDSWSCASTHESRRQCQVAATPNRALETAALPLHSDG